MTRRTHGRLLGGLAALAAATLLLVQPARPAAACSGLPISFADGISHASAVYYADVVSSTWHGSTFQYVVDLDVGRTVWGTPRTHLAVSANDPCTGVDPGQHGIVVLGVLDDQIPDQPRRADLFYFIGPYGTGVVTIRDAFRERGLPATDAVSSPAPSVPNDSGPLIVAAGLLSGAAVLARGRRRSVAARRAD